MKKTDWFQITILLIIYFLMNVCVFFTFAYLFNFQKDFLFYLLFSISFLSFITLTFLEIFLPNPITRTLYIIAVSWSGFLLFFMSFMGLYALLNLFFTIPNHIAGVLIFVFGVSTSIYSLINALIIRTKEIEIPIKKLKNEMKIVQLSDLHLGAVYNYGYLKKIVRKVKVLNPDIVVITGDFFDGTISFSRDKMKILNEITAPIFFIFGNHEISASVPEIYDSFSSTKVRILKNEVINYKGIQIIGIEYGGRDKKYLDKILPKLKIDKSKPAILLYHAPLHSKVLEDSGINLFLSGHLHGGQIFPVHIIAKIGQSHYRGLKKNGNSHMHISQGTGTWGPPMRFFSYSEITLINLKKEKRF